jgi:hypothetical protein
MRRIYEDKRPSFRELYRMILAAQELPARPSNNRKAGASLPVSAAALCKQLPDRTLPAPGAGITNKRMPGVRPDILRSNNVPAPGN